MQPNDEPPKTCMYTNIYKTKISKAIYSDAILCLLAAIISARDATIGSHNRISNFITYRYLKSK